MRFTHFGNYHVCRRFVTLFPPGWPEAEAEQIKREHGRPYVRTEKWLFKLRLFVDVLQQDAHHR